MANRGMPLAEDTTGALNQVDELSDANELPFVSVIIPMRNEERYVSACLESVLANDYPQDRLEIFCVDGMSEDGTREIVQRFIKENALIKLLDNPKLHNTAAFNIGVRRAKGQLIVIVGAHCTYEKDYISKSVRFLYKYSADNVGGIWKIIPRDNSLIGTAIAMAMASPFGSGNAYTKIGSKGPRWVDTVFGGCYRKEVFEEIGLFDEDLKRSQDMEFNLRLKRAGGKILLVPDIKCNYFARTDIREFCGHNFDDGFWTFYPLRFGKRTFAWRHTAPLVFAAFVLASGALSAISFMFLAACLTALSGYALVDMVSSIHIGVREKSFKLAFLLPLVFFARHATYSVGSFFGITKALVSKTYWQRLASTDR